MPKKNKSSRRRQNKGLKIFAGILISLAIIAVLYFTIGKGLVQTNYIPSGTYYNTPTFGYYKCAPASSQITSAPKAIGSSGSGFITCPSPNDQCSVKLLIPSSAITSWTSFYRVIYQVCDNNGNCEQQQFPTVSTFTAGGSGVYSGFAVSNAIQLAPISGYGSSSIWVDFQQWTLTQGWHDVSGSQIQFTYTPFVLYKYDSFSSANGQPYTSLTQGCTFPNSNTINNLLASSTLGTSITGTQTSNANNYLTPYQTRTFVSNFVPIALDNSKFQTYSGQQAYCTGNTVYKIGTVTTNLGTYNIVNYDSNQVLGNVACCNGDTKPNYQCVNNQWQIIQTSSSGQSNIQCSAFNPCPDVTPQVYNDSYTIQQSCVSGQCVSSYTKVQCTNQNICGSGKTCDLSTYKCVDVQGGVAGNVSSSSTDTNKSQCKWYQDSVQAQTPTQSKILGIISYGPTTIVTTNSCVTSTWFSLLIWVVIISIVVGIILFVIWIKNKVSNIGNVVRNKFRK